jgi:bacterioferritin
LGGVATGRYAPEPRKPGLLTGPSREEALMTTPNKFALDITKIREDARAKMAQGAVTSDHTSDVKAVIDVLNEVVATEIVCWMRYTQHAIVATGINRAQVTAEFTEHAAEERQHMERAAERISQLGGTPDLSPAGLSKSHTEYVEVDDSDLTRMLEENLVAERIVISSYQEIVRWLGDSDPTTRRLMESILAEEEEHADDLNDLLGN